MPFVGGTCNLCFCQQSTAAVLQKVPIESTAENVTAAARSDDANFDGHSLVSASTAVAKVSNAFRSHGRAQPRDAKSLQIEIKGWI